MKLTLTALGALALVAGLWLYLHGGDEAGRGIARRGGAGGAALTVSPSLASAGAADGAPARSAAADLAQATVAADAAPAEPRAPGPATISARAVTAGGRPVGGAWLGVRHGPWAPAAGDASGELRLELPAADFERFVEQQTGRAIQLELGAPRHAQRTWMRTVAEGESQLELGEVLLEPGADLFGRVVDAGGLGVAGAIVVFGEPVEAAPDEPRPAHKGPPELGFPGWGPFRYALTTSGPGGAFRLEGLAPGHGSVWARGETTLWTWSEPVGLRAGEEAGEVVLVLREAPERLVSGRLVDPEGRAVAGLLVACRGPGQEWGWSRARTDGDGRFVFLLEQPGEYRLQAAPPSWEWDPAELEGVRPGTRDLVLAYRPSTWLWLVVRDGAGRPLPDGRVFGVPAEGGTDGKLPRCETTLDADGRGRLRTPSEPFRVRAEAPGFRNALLGPFDPATFPDPLVVTLEPAPAIMGRVSLPDGSPAAGARVSLHRGPTDPRGWPRLTHGGWRGDGEPFVYAAHLDSTARVQCDAQGRFRLPLPGIDVRAEGEQSGLDPELAARIESRRAQESASSLAGPPTWFVHAALEGHATRTVGPLSFEGLEDVELALALPAAGGIAGRLVLEEGGEPRGYTVRAADGLAQVVEAPVASDGTFGFEHLHPGPWQVRAFEPEARFYLHADSATEEPFVPDVEVRAGRTVSYEHRVRARPRARLLGRLTLDGAAPGPWRVYAVSRRSTASMLAVENLTLDPDGHFELVSEVGIRVALDLQRPRSDAPILTVSTEVELLAGDNPWSLDLVTASLEGFVDPARAPAPRQSGGGGELRYEADRDGIALSVRFHPDEAGRFGPLTVPAGPGTLRGPRPLNREPGPIWAQLDLRPGERRELDLR